MQTAEVTQLRIGNHIQTGRILSEIKTSIK